MRVELLVDGYEDVAAMLIDEVLEDSTARALALDAELSLGLTMQEVGDWGRAEVDVLWWDGVDREGPPVLSPVPVEGYVRCTRVTL